MPFNSHTPDNLQLTIIRQPLTVNSDKRLSDVIALINEAQGNFNKSPLQDGNLSKNSSKQIDYLTSQVASCVLVIDNSQLVGIITQRDLMKLTAERKNLESISIAEVMTRELITLKLEDFKDVFTALNLLRQHRIYHLPIVGEQGEVIGIVTPTSLLEITIQQARLYNYARVKLAERQRIEAELRLERNFISAILNLTDALVVVLDSQGRIVRFNQTCEQATGYAFDAAKEKFVWDVLLLPETTECLKDIFQNLAQREFPQRYETILINQDSDRRLISWSNKVLLNYDGQVEYIVCTGIDITESRKAQEELQQTRNFLQSMINNLPVAVFVKDAKPENFGKFKLWNHTCERLFGVNSEQAIGKTDYEFFPKTQADFFRQKDQAAFASGIPQDISEEPIETPNFGRRILHTTKIPLYDKDQQPEYLLCISEDITERKQTEIALQSLIESTASTTGQDFFSTLVEHISSTLDVRHTLVTELIDGQFHTLGFWSDGQLQPNISYDLTSTPYEILLQQGYYYCTSEIQQLFSTAQRCAVMQAESSVGVILSDDFGNPIGSLCIIDEKPISDTHKFEGILRVFAARASAELQRKRTQEALQQLNRELEARVEQRTLELQESEAELRAIFNQAAVGIKLETLDGQFLKVNQKLCEMLGYSQAELMNKNFKDITYTDDIACHQNNLQKLIAGEIETFSIEKRCLHKNGKFIWINLTVSLIRDLTGKPIYSVGIVKDIRNQKQAEEDLKRQFAAVEAAIDGIAILNGDTYIYVNQAHVEMFGYSHPEEFIGKSWIEIYNPQEIQRFQTDVFPILMQQKHWRGETIAKKKDGTSFEEEVSLTISEQGDLICVCRDISEQQAALRDRKKAEADICKALEKEKELSELKSRFISMTSHEFRTPLAVIASSAGILKSFSHKLDEQQKQKHLQCIQTYVQHTTQLLDDILLINKAEAGKLSFEPNCLELVNFCHTLVEEIQLSSPQYHLSFCAQYKDSLSACGKFVAFMDKKLLRQILSNLLSNAIKYSPDSSNIQIDLSIQDKSVIFLIQDEGIGISPQEQQHLFEPFYRASNVGNVPGTGLGLVIVEKCVELHQGRITIASQIGFGTTFRVELPLIFTNICE